MFYIIRKDLVAAIGCSPHSHDVVIMKFQFIATIEILEEFGFRGCYLIFDH